MLSTRERNDVLFFSYIPRRSIYSIFADQLGWFGGSMVAYIPYMECMGYYYIYIYMYSIRKLIAVPVRFCFDLFCMLRLFTRLGNLEPLRGWVL